MDTTRRVRRTRLVIPVVVAIAAVAAACTTTPPHSPVVDTEFDAHEWSQVTDGAPGVAAPVSRRSR